jgi:NTP pyrophosphatase (non-canonical NTP hydrolase)
MKIGKELYQELALTFYGDTHVHAQNLKAGLREEVEEVCNATSRENLIEELGDLLWYVTILADNAGLDLGDIMLANINKLERRALNGK